MQFSTNGIVSNEDTPVKLADMVGHYKRSKFLAEQEAIKAARGRALGRDPQSQQPHWF